MFYVRSIQDLRTWIEWHGVVLTAIATGVLAAAAVAALVIACFYLDRARAEARVARLLELVREFQSPELAAARADL